MYLNGTSMVHNVAAIMPIPFCFLFAFFVHRQSQIIFLSAVMFFIVYV